MIEWLQDFEDAEMGEPEMEPGQTLAAVFRVGDRTLVEIAPGSDDEHALVTAQGFPEALTVPRAAFRVVEE